MPTTDVGSPIFVCDPCGEHDVLDGVMLECDPCSGHISTENDIWMMVVMVVMLVELMPLCR